ncbi:MAG: SurA N-terminal domain-containing protein, partial [Pseudomonadales bacterium]|nr:SurA N-terminal domain-containing protein [Pseudomonadales bacterium]
MNRIKTMLALICASTVLHAQASLVILDKIVAIVDEDVVMLSELELRQNTIRAQLTAAGQQVPPDDILTSQIVERLIVESLQLQMADRAGVRISDEELNSAMESIALQNNLSLTEFRLAIENDG